MSHVSMHNEPQCRNSSSEGAWCAPLFQRLLPLKGAGGHQSLLSNLPFPFTPNCVPRPPSPLSPLLCSNPNKLATQVGGGRRSRMGGGWALWRRSRLSVGEVHGALKLLCLSAHTHALNAHTPCLSDWMLRGRTEERNV